MTSPLKENMKWQFLFVKKLKVLKKVSTLISAY